MLAGLARYTEPRVDLLHPLICCIRGDDRFQLVRLVVTSDLV